MKDFFPSNLLENLEAHATGLQPSTSSCVHIAPSFSLLASRNIDKLFLLKKCKNCLALKMYISFFITLFSANSRGGSSPPSEKSNTNCATLVTQIYHLLHFLFLVVTRSPLNFPKLSYNLFMRPCLVPFVTTITN